MSMGLGVGGAEVQRRNAPFPRGHCWKQAETLGAQHYCLIWGLSPLDLPCFQSMSVGICDYVTTGSFTCSRGSAGTWLKAGRGPSRSSEVPCLVLSVGAALSAGRIPIPPDPRPWQNSSLSEGCPTTQFLPFLLWICRKHLPLEQKVLSWRQKVFSRNRALRWFEEEKPPGVHSGLQKPHFPGSVFPSGLSAAPPTCREGLGPSGCHFPPSVQFSCSVVSNFATPWIAALQAFLSITNSRSPPKPMSIELVMPSNHLILCCPFLLPPSIFPSIRIFSNESALHIRWPKYWSFSFNTSSSKEHPGLISFRMDWLDLLAVQGTLKGLHQHHSSKASILQRSAFFIVQLSHLYLATGKTIALTRWTFVGKVMSLLFNMLSRLVINFLPGSKCLLILWLQSPSAVILEPRMCIYKRNPGRVSCVQPWWVTQAVEEVI